MLLVSLIDYLCFLVRLPVADEFVTYQRLDRMLAATIVPSIPTSTHATLF